MSVLVSGGKDDELIILGGELVAKMFRSGYPGQSVSIQFTFMTRSEDLCLEKNKHLVLLAQGQC